MLDVNLLDYVTGSIAYDTFRGEPCTYSQRFYGRYPGHAPVYCVEIRGLTRCVVQLGMTYALPVMRHYGYDQIPCQW